MAECVEQILSNEELWDQWKQNKCPNFEKPPSGEAHRRLKTATQRKPTISTGPGGKLQPPLLGYWSNIVQPKDKDMVDSKNGLEMKRYLRYPKESIDSQGHSINIKPCEIPTLGDYMYNYLVDQDPDQGIEESYKKKKDIVFTWRFLRSISFLDLINFLSRPESRTVTTQ